MSSCISRVSVDCLSTSFTTVQEPQNERFFISFFSLNCLLETVSVQLHCSCCCCSTSSQMCCSSTPTSSRLLLPLRMLMTHILHTAPLPNGSFHNRHQAAVGRTVFKPHSCHRHCTRAVPFVRRLTARGDSST